MEDRFQVHCPDGHIRVLIADRHIPEEHNHLHSAIERFLKAKSHLFSSFVNFDLSGLASSIYENNRRWGCTEPSPFVFEDACGLDNLDDDTELVKVRRSGKRFCWRYGKAMRLGGHYGGYTGDPFYDSNNYYHEHYRTSRDRFRDRRQFMESAEELNNYGGDADDYDYRDY